MARVDMKIGRFKPGTRVSLILVPKRGDRPPMITTSTEGDASKVGFLLDSGEAAFLCNLPARFVENDLEDFLGSQTDMLLHLAACYRGGGQWSELFDNARRSFARRLATLYLNGGLPRYGSPDKVLQGNPEIVQKLKTGGERVAVIFLMDFAEETLQVHLHRDEATQAVRALRRA